MIEIVDESTEMESRLVLLIDGNARATLTQKQGRPPYLNWQIYGPQQWPDAKEILLGLLELSVHAEHGEKRCQS